MHDGEDSFTASRQAAAEEFGPYRVYERLGVGGMATVHRAKKCGIAGFERGVALKRMLPHISQDAEFISSFVHEAKLASLLLHPNIAQIYDFGQIDRVYYIAMEHVDGFDARKLLRYSHQHKELTPVNVVLSILCELCEALEYAHTFVDEFGQPQGIVHRDVSPSNLIVARSGHLKVIDFGIAKASGRPVHTEAGLVKGKFGYMSPEAVVGRPVGPRSDVFSAGVVAYELLTARPLFSGGTQYETLRRISEAEIPPPSVRNPRVPAALDRVVLAALERDEGRRWQTAGGFRQALEQVASETGIRLSAADVAEWSTRVTVTSDPGGSHGSAPSIPRSAAVRAFPRLVSPGSAPPEDPLISVELSGGQPPQQSADVRSRSASRASSADSLSGDSLAGFDAQPLGSVDRLAGDPPSPAGAPNTAGLPAPRRARSRWRAVVALAGLCAIAAGLAVYQLTAHSTGAVAPALSVPTPPAPALSVVRFIVQPPDSIIVVGANEVSRHSPYEARLERGVYSIAVSHAGYKRWTKEITLQDPGSQTVNVALEPATAIVRLSSEPAGLVAQLDGKPLGQLTPAKFETSPGFHRLIVASATRTWTHDFEAASDETYAFHALLAPTAKRAPATATTSAVTRTTPPPPERVPQRASSGNASRTPVARDPVGEAEDHVIDLAPESSAAKPLPKPEPALTAAAQPGVTVALPAPPRPAAPAGAPPLVPASTVTKLSGEVPAIQSGTGSADVYTKICIAIDGHVTSVKIIRSSAGIAAELQRALLEWRYKPYIDEAGQPSPACFAVNFRLVFDRAH